MLAISEMPLFGEYSVPDAFLGMSSKLVPFAKSVIWSRWNFFS